MEGSVTSAKLTIPSSTPGILANPLRAQLLCPAALPPVALAVEAGPVDRPIRAARRVLDQVATVVVAARALDHPEHQQGGGHEGDEHERDEKREYPSTVLLLPWFVYASTSADVMVPTSRTSHGSPGPCLASKLSSCPVGVRRFVVRKTS